MINNQAVLFLIFSLNGVIIGLIFDFFRILRKSFKTSNLMTSIQDIIFWIITGISVIFFMYNFSDGTIRFYMFLSLLFGFIIYILAISPYIIKIFVYIIKTVKTILNSIIKFIIYPLKKIITFFKNRHYSTKYNN